jgi:hypothetical protein
LALHIEVELAVDAGDAHADADLAGSDRDLRLRFADIAGRVGIGHVAGDESKPGLVDAQAGHRGAERLHETHGRSLTPDTLEDRHRIMLRRSCTI